MPAPRRVGHAVTITIRRGVTIISDSEAKVVIAQCLLLSPTRRRGPGRRDWLGTLIDHRLRGIPCSDCDLSARNAQ